MIEVPNIEVLKEESWALAMADCEHQSEHHAEGDVWTHTLFALHQLGQQPEYLDLPKEDQVILNWATLLHDVGKPETATREDGRIHFPKHSIKGAKLARRILIQQGCDWKTRERIANLVRYHGQPPFILQSKTPQNWTIDLSWRVETLLLYMLCISDALGRKAKNMSEYPDWIKLWRVMAEENDCFGKPYPFVNNHARFLFFKDLLSSLYYTPFEDFQCQMILMSGLPGVGKDTWVAQNKPDIPMISLDDLRMEMGLDPTDNQGTLIQEAKQQMRKHLANKTTFVFNATNLGKTSRSKWTRLAHDYRASIKIVYLERPLATILQQNKQREQAVPEYIIHGMLENLEVPDLTECHELVEI